MHVVLRDIFEAYVDLPDLKGFLLACSRHSRTSSYIRNARVSAPKVSVERKRLGTVFVIFTINICIT